MGVGLRRETPSAEVWTTPDPEWESLVFWTSNEVDHRGRACRYHRLKKMIIHESLIQLFTTETVRNYHFKNLVPMKTGFKTIFCHLQEMMVKAITVVRRI